MPSSCDQVKVIYFSDWIYIYIDFGNGFLYFSTFIFIEIF